jgi:hypothetical protein
MTNRAYDSREREQMARWPLSNPTVSSSPVQEAFVSSIGKYGIALGRRTNSPENRWFSEGVHKDGTNPRANGVLASYELQMMQYVKDQEAKFQELRREYILLHDLNNLESYLRDHSALVDVLLDAVPHLKACFGDNLILQIRLADDEETSKTVCATILWRKDPASARAALNSFDESWWIDNVKRASGKVVFDYELA